MVTWLHGNVVSQEPLMCRESFPQFAGNPPVHWHSRGWKIVIFLIGFAQNKILDSVQLIPFLVSQPETHLRVIERTHGPSSVEGDQKP